MTTRIWLKDGLQEEEKLTGFEKITEVDKITGGRFVIIHDNLMSPTTGIPNIDSKYIDRVTFMDSYTVGFRCDGLYQLKNATALVKTEGHDDRYQRISICAPTVEVAREIYTQVRNGKLRPFEDWSGTPASSDQDTPSSVAADEVAGD